MTAPKTATAPTTSNTTKITTIDATTTVTVPAADNIKDSAVTATDKVVTDADTDAAVTTTEEESPEQRDQRILTYQLLAGQLEYYFSVTNLSRDTYLSTLIDLNDGYVPLSIIANFGKVQAFAPYESAWDAVCAAATDYSDLLEMVELDEQGKKVSVTAGEEESSSNKTFLAVGTISGEAISMSQIQTQRRSSSSNNDTLLSTADKTPSHPSSPTSVRTPSSGSTATVTASSSNNKNNMQNTIILREVSDDVEEEVVRSLFDFDNCPSIQTVHLDLHNCWFVTLDTSSRDEMVSVMMNLRTKKFPSGDSVKARLKSSASAATLSPLSANAVIYTHPKASAMYAPQFYSNNSGNNNGGSNSRKKRSSNHKGRNSNRDSNNGGGGNYDNRANNQQGAVNGGHQSKRRNGKDESSGLSQTYSSDSNNDNNNFRNNNSNNKVITAAEKTMKPSPSMCELNFPSLPPTTDDDSKPFQVEKVPTEDEMMRGGEKGQQDSSSTATATSTSPSTSSTPTEDIASSSIGIVSGGYAAALLRPAAPTPPFTTTTKSTKKAKEQQKRESSQPAKQQQQRSSKSKGVENVKKNQDKNTVEKSSPSDSDEQPVVSVQPPAWGRGRSFADVLAAV